MSSPKTGASFVNVGSPKCEFKSTRTRLSHVTKHWRDSQNFSGLRKSTQTLLLLTLVTKILSLTLFQSENIEEYRQQASIKLTEAQSFVLERFETAILVIQKQVPVVHEFLLEYNLDKIFTNIFEGIGRSVLWTGDLIGKLAAGRFCCAQVRCCIIFVTNIFLRAKLWASATKSTISDFLLTTRSPTLSRTRHMFLFIKSFSCCPFSAILWVQLNSSEK